jgi:type I restriction-modification system DNA methylase subunit
MAKTKKEKTAEEKPFEQMLWAAADKMRKNIDAAEYKYLVFFRGYFKWNYLLNCSNEFNEVNSLIEFRLTKKPFQSEGLFFT